MLSRSRCRVAAHHAVWMLAVACLSLGLGREAQAQGFGPKTPFTTGSTPYAVAIGDLNGDGKPDMAVANWSASTVSVLLGAGGGSFGAKTDFATATNPTWVAIGDLNGDGRPDLAVAAVSSSAVSVLLGTGGGSFGAKTDFTTGSAPFSLAIGDLNEDGKPDLAVTNIGTSTVSVLLGTGGGSFGAKTDFATGTSPYSLAIGDLNGDGRPDLATANQTSSTVSVLLGTGGGSFGAKTDFATGASPNWVAIGDLDGDGKLDLAAASLGSNAVSVLLGTGGGSFGARTDFSTGASPASVAIGDVNADGKLDLVVANAGSTTASVLLGIGGGAFGAKSDYDTGTPQFVAMGDLNADGRPDLAVVNGGGPTTVSVLLNLYPPPPALPVYTVTEFTTGTNPQSVAIEDLNVDGRPDLAVANQISNTVSVLLGTGAGAFGAKTDFATGADPFSVAIGDVNADGKPDLVTANRGPNSVSVLLGTGGGSFGAKTDFAAGSVPISVAIGDLNRDGRPDIAVANQNANTVSVLLGAGGGSFGAKTDYATGAAPRSVAIGDLNADGKLDLAVANEDDNFITVLLGNGAGSFSAGTGPLTGTTPRSVAIGDLNVDGKADLVTANRTGSVSVILGTGGGSFAFHTDLATDGQSASVAIGDLNGDGKPDLAAANNSLGAASVFLGTGGGSFGARTDYSAGSGPQCVAIGDLNVDGRPDLAVGRIPPNLVSVLLNAIDPPTVTVTAPNGGETIGKGTTTDITWTATDNLGVDHVDLYYSLNGGATYTPIAANQPNSGTYSWSVPAIATNTTVRVRVVAFDASGGSGADASDGNFTIVDASAPAVTVLAPNGGETIGKGTTTGIAWTASDNVGVSHVDLSYSLDGGAMYDPIASNQPNSGAYSWSVPAIATHTTVRVRVVAFDASGNSGEDASDGDFTIEDAGAPVVTVLAPNGGETLAKGTTADITWTASDNVSVDHVDLSYSLNGGSSYAPIASNQPNSGTYGWSVPSIATNHTVRVRVAAFDASGNNGVDASNANFSIDDVGVYPTGLSPISVAVGDLNGDGKSDLATANISSNTVSVLLGNGGGGLGPQVEFAGGSTIQWVSIGDLNGDGKPDLVLANSTPNTVSVLLGTGGGSYGARTTFATGVGPSCVAIGDLNGDGIPDLATANLSSSSVSVLLGTGTGSFGANTNFTVGANPIRLAIDDLNADGKLDLAVANFSSNTVSVLLGAGDGSFGAKTDFATGTGPRSVAIGDLNGDGKLDLALTNSSGNSVSALLGTGTGSFGASTSFPTGSSPQSVVIGDLNGDGNPDLALVNQISNTGSVLLGVGDGNFGAKTDFATGSAPAAVATGEMNGDGKPDLVVANPGSHDVSMILNAYPPTPASTATRAFGRTDFATATYAKSVAIGDVNRDGKPDLVAASTDDNAVSVLLGAGGGSFGAKTDFSAGTRPFAVAIGDLNHDGKPDLAVGNVGDAFLVGRSVSVLLGAGDGSFGPKTEYAVGGSATCVAIGDLDGDGKPDLVVGSAGASGAVSVFLGTGGGAFGPRTDFATGGGPLSVAIGDLNRDGRPDLAVANTPYVSVLLGTGGGSFGPRTEYLTGINPRSVAIGDLNNDGLLDLATANSSNTVSVLLGTGGGSFGPQAQIASGGAPVAIAAGDLNRDGKLDLAVVNGNAYTVSVMLGTGGGSFGPNAAFATVAASHSVAIGDLNLDGLPDLATANGFANSVSVLLNVLDTTPPAVHVTSPDGGETIDNATTRTITWTASDAIGVDHVNLDYSINGGATYVPIVADRPDSGSYVWSDTSVPATTAARIRVTAFDVSGNSGADGSDANFTITDTTVPEVTLLYPNEEADNVTTITVEWIASDNVAVDHVDIYLSTNGGSSFTLLAAGQVNDGSYDWDGAPLTTQGRVRIVAFDASGNSAFDDSDENVTIVNSAPPAIPSPFTGVFPGGPVQLHWGANAEEDFAVYHLYRGATADFVPAPGNLVVSQADTGYVDSGSTWSFYKLSALDALGIESGFALLAPAGSFTGNTPPGDSVTTSPSPTVQLTFQNVTSGGQTQLTTQTGGTVPPNGLKVAPSSPTLYYVLSTTATFTGAVTVCVTYDPDFISGQEKNLKLMHYDTALNPAAWVQVTTSRDTAANEICGTVTHFSEFALMETDGTVDVEEPLPSTLQLYSCAPNPVSGRAQVTYDLPVATTVRLGLYDLQGRLVRELERAPSANAGRHIVQWDGRGAHGERLRAGVYFLWLEAGGIRQMRRVVVTK